MLLSDNEISLNEKRVDFEDWKKANLRHTRWKKFGESGEFFAVKRRRISIGSPVTVC